MAKGLKRLFKQGRWKNVTRKKAKAARSGSGKRAGGKTGSGTTFGRIRRAIRRIPLGEVRTYGEIAAQVGVSVRTVVWALRNCSADVPWHRVIGKPDRIVLVDRSPLLGAEQANRLCQEGWIVRDWRVVGRSGGERGKISNAEFRVSNDGAPERERAGKRRQKVLPIFPV